jgi:hypothetical protein
MLERVRQGTRSAMAMPFRSVDVAEQAKAYRLEERGAEDGAANRPEPGSDVPAIAEQEILTASVNTTSAGTETSEAPLSMRKLSVMVLLITTGTEYVPPGRVTGTAYR